MSSEILLPEGDIWSVHGNIDYALLLMLQLFTHDFRVNDRVVYPALGIDMATRRKNQNLPNVESKRTHEYRYINKGLAMELLVGMVLTHLDTPAMVRNWCASPGGLPRSHAPPGKVDVEASYAPDDGSPPFRLIAEVSAKRRVSPGFLKKQLAQAHSHAMELVEDDVGGKVYILVINGCNVIDAPKHGDVFHEFVRANGLQREDHRVCVVPINALAFVVALRTLIEETSIEQIGFSPTTFAWILRKQFRTLFSSLQMLRENPDKLGKIWVEGVLEEQKRLSRGPPRRRDDDSFRH